MSFALVSKFSNFCLVASFRPTVTFCPEISTSTSFLPSTCNFCFAKSTFPASVDPSLDNTNSVDISFPPTCNLPSDVGPNDNFLPDPSSNTIEPVVTLSAFTFLNSGLSANPISSFPFPVSASFVYCVIIFLPTYFLSISSVPIVGNVPSADPAGTGTIFEIVCFVPSFNSTPVPALFTLNTVPSCWVPSFPRSPLYLIPSLTLAVTAFSPVTIDCGAAPASPFASFNPVNAGNVNVLLSVPTVNPTLSATSFNWLPLIASVESAAILPAPTFVNTLLVVISVPPAVYPFNACLKRVCAGSTTAGVSNFCAVAVFNSPSAFTSLSE